MTKQVTLPSGRQVEIRALGPLGLRELLKVSPAALGAHNSTATNLDVAIALVSS